MNSLTIGFFITVFSVLIILILIELYKKRKLKKEILLIKKFNKRKQPN